MQEPNIEPFDWFEGTNRENTGNAEPHSFSSNPVPRTLTPNPSKKRKLNDEMTSTDQQRIDEMTVTIQSLQKSLLAARVRATAMDSAYAAISEENQRLRDEAKEASVECRMVREQLAARNREIEKLKKGPRREVAEQLQIARKAYDTIQELMRGELTFDNLPDSEKVKYSAKFCCVCRSVVPNGVLILSPCGHQAVCHTCCGQLDPRQCPLCRTGFRTAINLQTGASIKWSEYPH